MTKTKDKMINALITKSCFGKYKRDAQSVIGELKISDKVVGNRLELSAKMPGNDRIYSASFEIAMPESTRLDLTSTNGNITISGIIAPISANTTNGAIGLTNTKGATFLSTTNGSINVQGHSGPIKGKTWNGSISCNLSEFNAADSNLFETHNGLVQLLLPIDASAKIEAYISNGNITIEGFDTIDFLERSKTRVYCQIGSGTEILIVKTANGDITIRNR